MFEAEESMDLLKGIGCEEALFRCSDENVFVAASILLFVRSEDIFQGVESDPDVSGEQRFAGPNIPFDFP